MASIGIDTHKASLACSAVDELGRQLAIRTFGNDPRGHAALLNWLQRQPAPRRVGIEGAGSFGAALAEVLVAAGETVVEVPAQFTDRERRSLLQRGKSDPGDALAIARLTAREPRLCRPCAGPGSWPTSSCWSGRGSSSWPSARGSSTSSTPTCWCWRPATGHGCPV